MTAIDKLCVLRLSAIGDCCHTLAVVRTLQQHLPDTELTWVIGKTEAGLMAGLDGVELIVFDKAGGRRAVREVQSALGGREFDVLLNMHASWRANRVSRLIRAQRRIGFDRDRARDLQWLFTDEHIAPQHQPHVIDGLFGFAERIGVRGRTLDWRLPIEDEHREFAATLADAGQPLVVISPCSSIRARNFRNWPASRYAAVAQHLADQYGARIAITGGGSGLEMEYAAEISDAGPDGVVDLVGKTSLKGLAAIIERAAFVLCPDSGPAHIATAVGTPVVGLYATSNPGRTGPVSSQATTINAYPRALEQFMGKTTDEVRWGQRVRHPDAMAVITVDEVTAVIDGLMA